MRFLNGRIILEHTHIKNFTEREFTKNATSSFIPNPVSLKKFKENWEIIKRKESYTKELLNQMSLYSDLQFKVREEDSVEEIKWLEEFDQEDYQINATIEMLNRYRLAIFFDTGTGKTVIAANYLLNRLEGKKDWNVIIVTKASVVKQYSFDLKALPKEMREENNIVVTSYGKMHQHSETDWDIVILDESHSAKNKSALTYDDAKKLVKEFTPFAFLMTATPQDKSKYEIIVQLSVLSSRFLHPDGATAFKERYFILDQYKKPQEDYKLHIEEVDDMISGVSISARADDVLDIPPMHTHLITKPNHQLFRDMAYRKYITVEDQTFIGDNKSRHRMYLRQITNGFIYEDYIVNPEADVLEWKVSKKTHRLHKEKQKSLYELMKNGYEFEMLNGSTTHLNPPENGIIFTLFDEDNRMVEEVLKPLGVSYRNALRVTPKKRDELIDDFKEGKYDFLIIKAASASAGLNLQRCNTVIWWTMPQEWVYFKQGRGRVHRRGQDKVQHEYVLINSSIDKDIYNMVAIQKKSYTDSSFDLFMNMVNKEGEKQNG
ncbi:MAG: DEAD/DEAH box helicase [Candidatus Izemoplasmatales bacterium]|nr:DEAD/DEAH box helicase [Candidatus Izemoplasmatales bacterium]